MTDNFNNIKQFIQFITPKFDPNLDQYYVIELIRRGKDNPDLPAANLRFKNYYINQISDLDKYKEEIMFLCTNLKIRAYFSVNYKLYSQVLMNTTAECARRVAVHDYKKPYAIYESCSGSFVDDGNKIWVIDVDKEDADLYHETLDSLVNIYSQMIINCRPHKDIIKVISTKSGKHIISYPFDIDFFNEQCRKLNMLPHSDTFHQIIKKNHLTLLYENL